MGCFSSSFSLSLLLLLLCYIVVVGIDSFFRTDCLTSHCLLVWLAGWPMWTVLCLYFAVSLFIMAQSIYIGRPTKEAIIPRYARILQCNGSITTALFVYLSWYMCECVLLHYYQKQVDSRLYEPIVYYMPHSPQSSLNLWAEQTSFVCSPHLREEFP